MSKERTELATGSPAEQALSELIEGLSANQAVALNALMQGQSISSAARAADVNRSTLYEWLEEGTPFAQALQKWKLDIAATARNRLLIMTDEATSAVMMALRRGDARTAMRLLEKLGIAAPPPVGKTHIEAQTQRAEAQAESAQRSTRLGREEDQILGSWDAIVKSTGHPTKGNSGEQSKPIEISNPPAHEQNRDGHDADGTGSRGA